MSKPVIFVAFANQDDNHLPLLKQESSEVKDALRVLETRDFIKVEREESAELKDLVNTFSSYPDQIQIFHYGGHAEGHLLQLEDKDAQSKGLAQLLGEQKELKLVPRLASEDMAIQTLYGQLPTGCKNPQGNR